MTANVPAGTYYVLIYCKRSFEFCRPMGGFGAFWGGDWGCWIGWRTCTLRRRGRRDGVGCAAAES